MKRKWTIIGLCAAEMVLILAVVFLPRILPSNGSRYSRKVEEDFFSPDMERLNRTIEKPFSLKEGDSVDVSIVRVSCELFIFIGK